MLLTLPSRRDCRRGVRQGHQRRVRVRDDLPLEEEGWCASLIASCVPGRKRTGFTRQPSLHASCRVLYRALMTFTSRVYIYCNTTDGFQALSDMLAPMRMLAIARPWGETGALGRIGLEANPGQLYVLGLTIVSATEAHSSPRHTLEARVESPENLEKSVSGADRLGAHGRHRASDWTNLMLPLRSFCALAQTLGHCNVGQEIVGSKKKADAHATHNFMPSRLTNTKPPCLRPLTMVGGPRKMGHYITRDTIVPEARRASR